MPQMSLRITDEVAAKLAELARSRGCSRQDVLRLLVEEEHGRLEAGMPAGGVRRVDQDELIDLLSVQARKGSVGAMRELRALIAPGEPGRPKKPEPEPAANDFDALDSGVVSMNSRRRAVG